MFTNEFIFFVYKCLWIIFNNFQIIFLHKLNKFMVYLVYYLLEI